MNNTPTANSKPTRAEMLNVLYENICYVNFTKIDGTQRRMICTLISDYLPERPVLDGSETPKRTPKRTPTNMVVWDVERGDWRSFNLDSVTDWGIENDHRKP